MTNMGRDRPYLETVGIIMMAMGAGIMIKLLFQYVTGDFISDVAVMAYIIVMIWGRELWEKAEEITEG